MIQINKIKVKNFKRLGNKEIDFKSGISLVVGGNNSGKSSVLHALAVWEYAKQVLIYEKSSKALCADFKGDGYGVTLDEFTPINIPSFKYLWTNLKATSGYTLSITAFWKIGEDDRYLEIGLAYGQEKLYIKKLSSNIQEGERVPRIAYLPTFAGINSKEEWHTHAVRNKLIGQGLAGSVLRNQIMELFLQNAKLRKDKKADRKKILDSDLKWIRENDAFELLNQTVFEIFKGILYPKIFNPEFHTNVQINFRKGQIVKNRFKPFPEYKERDIMVEGSGFLQWLSVYTMAVTPSIDMLLLDEPDAHLHCSLQSELFSHLNNIAIKRNKQILIATHSTEIIKSYDYNKILFATNTSVHYLSSENEKIKIMAGIGSEYFPLLESVQKSKRILFVENKSDAEILKTLCEKYSTWPQNIVVWPRADKSKERTTLFLYLKEQIPDLKCISLSDRDNGLYREGTSDLRDVMPDLSEGASELRYRKWRRWEFESYLISPPAISRMISKLNNIEYDDASERLTNYVQSLGIVINDDYKQTDRTRSNAPLFDLDAKSLLYPIYENFGIDKFAIVKEMEAEDIFDDVKTLINEIVELCS